MKSTTLLLTMMTMVCLININCQGGAESDSDVTGQKKKTKKSKIVTEDATADISYFPLPEPIGSPVTNANIKTRQ